MSFPTYVEYKDSGVEWLGEVPAHWHLAKLKYFASFTGGGTPSRDNMAFWGGDIPWVSPKDMKVETLVEAEESITAAGLECSASSLVQPGQILMVVRSGILKHTIPVAINTVEVALNQDMKALRLDSQRCRGKFVLRWVQGLNDQLLLVWAKQGATVESIEHSYLAASIVPLPPLSEQDAINSVLDRETTKIDALVEEQQRLIELLREKRQAVISQAVTKGLDPSVPMKDSGVGWLGLIPKHWNSGALTRVADRVVVGIAEAATHAYADEGVAILRSTNIRAGKIVGEILYVTQEFAEGRATKLINAGDLVTVRTGNAGVTAVVPEHLDGCQCFTMLITSLSKLGLPAFYCYAMNSLPSLKYFSLEGWGTAQVNISVPILKALPIAIPPPTEQRAIVEYLNEATEKLDALVSEAESASELLRERRSALISAAVTGKIDVRGLVPQPEAVAA